MNDTRSFLSHHGPFLLFGTVFIEQLGLPLPAAPVLLAAGALAATGAMNWPAALALAVLGSLLADLLWFSIARRRGRRLLGFLCRMSLEPETCVCRTEGLLARYDGGALIAAKFLPGLSLVVPPLAAISGTSLRRFLGFDTLGSILYAGSYLVLGFLFNQQLLRVLGVLGQIGKGAVLLALGLLGAYVAFKYLKRRRVRRRSLPPAAEPHQQQSTEETLSIA